jgi:pimeloyl-ACP methyl ester carboxylesterase
MLRTGILLLLLLLQTAAAWAIKPLATYWAKPDTLGLKYQDLTLTTPDHVQLASWLVEPRASAPDQHTTMVVASGDWGNMSYSLYQAAALAAAGYRVLLFDYRGFGHSAAFAIDRDYLYYEEFATDLRAALAEARRLSPRQRVGIIGFSMGTLLGAEVAATTRCDFLITDGYVGNLQAIVAYQQTAHQRQTKLPAEATTYNPLNPSINCPWLFIAGTQDPQTPLADSVAAVRAARPQQNRQLLTVQCGHLGAMEKLTKKDYGDGYTRVVSRFLAGKRIAAKS